MNHLSTFCETNEKLEEERHKYAVKHGFVHTVPRLFKKCIVVRWKLKSLRNKFSHQTFSQKSLMNTFGFVPPSSRAMISAKKTCCWTIIFDYLKLEFTLSIVTILVTIIPSGSFPMRKKKFKTMC